MLALTRRMGSSQRGMHTVLGRFKARLETWKSSWKRRRRVGTACRVDRTTMAMSSAYALYQKEGARPV